MNIAWLILDSLSFSATPFAEDGPDTMPQLAALAEREASIFTRAYTPGNLSMSAHGSLFTGELPSTTGMHEAHPTFTGSVPTIAGALADTHNTHLVTTNPWLLRGLDEDFDTVDQFLNPYLVFDRASDPYEFVRRSDPDKSKLNRYSRFLREGGKPFRSLVNGVAYKIGFTLNPRDHMLLDRIGDEEGYQYANTINEKIRRRLHGDGDRFVVANYMDVHPPFDASDEALSTVRPDLSRADFPIGVGAEQTRSIEEKSYDVDRMTDLYHAAIIDLDRKLAPFIEELLEDDTLVIITADHGSFFQHNSYSDGQRHVPLLVFAPDREPRTVEHTVSLRTIPQTILEAATGASGEFTGPSLLGVSEDQTAITEIIRAVDIPEEMVVPTDPGPHHEIRRDIVLQRGDCRLEYRAGEWGAESGDKECLQQLRDTGEDLLSQPVAPVGGDHLEFDDTVKGQLEDLGYM